jgi:hypothetical protein
MKASAPMPTARITLPSVHEVGATANRPLPSELKSRAGKDGAFLHDHRSGCLSWMERGGVGGRARGTGFAGGTRPSSEAI